MKVSPTSLLGVDASDEGIAKAADVLANGGLAAFPSETVYGLGADARRSDAVKKIYAAKGRPSFNPLIVHVPSLEAAAEFVLLSPLAQRLAEAFWPGPLTLVLPLRPDSGIAPEVSAGLSTLAIRVPAHPIARALLERFGGPIAAPSANPSGRISPTSARHVAEGLGPKVDIIVDGGACDVGVESTILAVTPAPVVLRDGGLSREALEAVLATPLEDHVDSQTAPSSPGQLLSHYAPRAKVRLNAMAPDPGEVYLGFGPGPADLNLSPSGNLEEAAARLFDYLHQLDAQEAPIAVAPIPTTGLGRAINDRLKRAAAPRD